MIVPCETAGVQPVIGVEATRPSNRPMASSNRVSTRPTIRPTINIIPMVPSPRGPITRPALTIGIIHQRLKIRGLQHQRRVIGHADDAGEGEPARKLGLRNIAGFTNGSSGREHVNDEQVECRRGDDCSRWDFAGTEPVQLLAAVQQRAAVPRS